jgi:hypothetical protein
MPHGGSNDDSAVAPLSRLSQLQSLDLQLTAVTENGVRRLQEALPNATIMYGASDASLKQYLTATIRFPKGPGSIGVSVAPMPKQLHARGHFGVALPPTIRNVAAPSTAVTDIGLATIISSQTELEELDLRDSEVTDFGLALLIKLTKLKRLDLRGTQVTEAGCDQLAKTLIGCEILR